MQEYELNTILELLPYANKTSWEQLRYQIYTMVQINSKKNYKPTDLLKFAWDNDNKEDTTISNRDIKRLKAEAEKVYKAISTAQNE